MFYISGLRLLNCYRVYLIHVSSSVSGPGNQDGIPSDPVPAAGTESMAIRSRQSVVIRA